MSKQVCDLVFKGRKILKSLTVEVEDYTCIRVASKPLDPVTDCHGLIPRLYWCEKLKIRDLRGYLKNVHSVWYWSKLYAIKCGSLRTNAKPIPFNIKLVFNIFIHKWPTLYFLGVFAILWQSTVSFVLSVRPSVHLSVRMEQLSSLWKNVNYILLFMR